MKDFLAMKTFSVRMVPDRFGGGVFRGISMDELREAVNVLRKLPDPSGRAKRLQYR
jgi:hypothetical protein